MPSTAQGMTTFGSREVSQLMRKARRVVTHPGLHILIAPKALETGRILVVTSRKTGNAAKRNKIRRRLKALFFEHQLLYRGCDCIIIVKKEGINLSFEQLQELLLQAFAQVPTL